MINPLLLTDSYKLSHKFLETPGIVTIYSNFTPRNTKYFKSLYPDFDDKIVWFGLQAFIQKVLLNHFNDFFSRRFDEDEFKFYLTSYIGMEDFSHFRALHELGYLPVEICALPEGTLVSPGIPCLTIQNTREGFEWLPNYLETIISAELWKPMTVATIGREFRKLSLRYSEETCDTNAHVNFQNHDFSFRGQASWESSASTGAGFLLNTLGTDNVPAVWFANTYYPHFKKEDGEITRLPIQVASVKASEHSVASIGINYFNSEDKADGELKYLKYLLEKHPEGILSYVADTYDYYGFLTEILPQAKEEIEERTGTLVIRPDTGNPVEVVCGIPTDKPLEEQTPEEKGSIQLLWELFGGTVNSKGYKVLNPKIGLIYGDGITYERAKQILQGLKDKGFASSNIVFGIGSWAITNNSRDSLGIAIKATAVRIEDKGFMPVYKDPKTDNKKKSAKGYLAVRKNEEGDLYLVDNLSDPFEAAKDTLLKAVFIDSNAQDELISFETIRTRIWGSGI